MNLWGLLFAVFVISILLIISHSRSQKSSEHTQQIQQLQQQILTLQDALQTQEQRLKNLESIVVSQAYETNERIKQNLNPTT